MIESTAMIMSVLTVARERWRAWTLLFAASPALFAQSGPQPVMSGTVVTGQCQGHESEPGCVLPNLFGSTGLTLFNTPAFSHFAHFVGAAQTKCAKCEK